MRKTWRAAGRGNRARVKGLFAPACAAVCTLILLTTAGASLIRRASGGDESRQAEPLPTLVLERTDIDSDVDMQLLIELIGKGETGNAAIDLAGDEPRVLIYHTHTKEAYFPSEKYNYEPDSGWRCYDDSMNVVAVGERLAQTLREKYGISVIHDTTNHEPPKLSSAYSRSLQTMLYYKEKYPSITLFIDLHRDAYGDPTQPADFITIDGREVARIMFVVGTGEGATGTGFGEMPDFASNYALAERLCNYLISINGKLVRNIRVKTGRYNQHVSSSCLLAEIGHNANTLEQALAAAEYLAEAIAAVAEIPGTDATPADMATPQPTPANTPQQTVLPLAP